jgi:hypothetical protein
VPCVCQEAVAYFKRRQTKIASLAVDFFAEKYLGLLLTSGQRYVIIDKSEHKICGFGTAENERYRKNENLEDEKI